MWKYRWRKPKNQPTELSPVQPFVSTRYPNQATDEQINEIVRNLRAKEYLDTEYYLKNHPSTYGAILKQEVKEENKKEKYNTGDTIIYRVAGAGQSIDQTEAVIEDVYENCLQLKGQWRVVGNQQYGDIIIRAVIPLKR